MFFEFILAADLAEKPAAPVKRTGSEALWAVRNHTLPLQASSVLGFDRQQVVHGAPCVVPALDTYLNSTHPFTRSNHSHKFVRCMGEGALPGESVVTKQGFTEGEKEKTGSFWKLPVLYFGPAARNRTWISAFGGPNSIH